MNKKWIGSVVVASVVLAGCNTLSQIDQEGYSESPVFPAVKDVFFKNGSYPNVQNLQQIREGATRDQLYDLIGRPHFAEGFGVREWDYLFHFNTDQGVKTCQYKILFDKDKRARHFHWAPTECADLLKKLTDTEVQEQL